MSALDHETITFMVERGLAKALSLRVTTSRCDPTEIIFVLNGQWKLHLDRDALDELHDCLGSPEAIRDRFEALAPLRLTFLSNARPR